MTDHLDTPADLLSEFGHPGRPRSDWEVLAEVWESSEQVRDACDGSFSTMVSHAYQDLGTDAALTTTVWRQIESAGYLVDRPKPIHFVKPKQQGWFSKLTRLGRRAADQAANRTRI